MKRAIIITSICVTIAVLSLTTTLNAQNKPVLKPMGGEAPVAHLTAYTVDTKPELTYQAWIRRDNVTLTSYRAFQHQKYPYFYPLAGPVTGLSLVSETSLPWPHHRGVFFGVDRVNGGNYWQDTLGRGQIRSRGVALGELSETSCVIKDACIWGRPNAEMKITEPIIEDSRTFTLKFIDGTPNYLIDAEIKLKALTDIKIEQTNHGLYGVRVTPELSVDGGGNMLTSTGKTNQKDTFGQPADWIAFYGKRAGTEVIEGVAVILHPKYPDTEKFPVFKDCKWFTRDYGNISPNPFQFIPKETPWEFKAGEEITLRYRTVAFAGTPEEAGIQKLSDEFQKTE